MTIFFVFCKQLNTITLWLISNKLADIWKKIIFAKKK